MAPKINRPTTITAFAAYNSQGKLKSFRYYPEPLGAFDIEIQITHCGVCHSDIHLIDGDWGKDIYPLVPGHEIIGFVSRAGKKVKDLKIGRRVGVGWQCGSCLKCEWCLSGYENLCSRSQATCVKHYGGFAEAVIVDSRFAFEIPKNIPSAYAAPLMCAGTTVFSPLKRHVVSGMKVGVIGIGGLGHLALQFAHAMKCEVTAFSHSMNKEKEARKLGCDHFIVIKDKKPVHAKDRSLDFILSTVYVPLDWEQLIKILRPNGKLCIVGAVPGKINVPVDPILTDQRAVVGSCIGGRKMIREMLEFSHRHGICAKVQAVPMAEVNKAIRMVRNNQARYRVVLETKEIRPHDTACDHISLRVKCRPAFIDIARRRPNHPAA